jgi:NRPS condensation-like uncharacterized protein
MGEFQIQFEMAFDGRLDAARLDRAVNLTMDAEPVLGCRFARDDRMPWWERLSPTARPALTVVGNEADYERWKTSRLDATVGPQLKACLWRADDGDRLLLKIAHHAADGGGSKEVGEIVAAIYTRLGGEPDYQPEPNLHGSRDPQQIMRRVPRLAYLKLFWNLLRRLWTGFVPLASHSMALPAGPREPWGYVVRHLDAARVARLAEHGRARQATLNDMLMAAFYRGLAAHTPWDGKSAHRVQMTVDYRRWYLPSQRGEAVCNISGFEHPFLGRELGRDFAETLARVSAITRRRKKDWFGLSELWLYKLLDLMSYTRLRETYARTLHRQRSAGNFPHALTNMGPIEPARMEFDGVSPRTAWLLCPVIYPSLFGAGVTGYKGTLTLTAGVPDNVRATIEDFMDKVVAELPA